MSMLSSHGFADFIDHYDHGREVAPFEADVELRP